jgi:hypothetical protein
MSGPLLRYRLTFPRDLPGRRPHRQRFRLFALLLRPRRALAPSTTTSATPVPSQTRSPASLPKLHVLLCLYLSSGGRHRRRAGRLPPVSCLSSPCSIPPCLAPLTGSHTAHAPSLTEKTMSHMLFAPLAVRARAHLERRFRSRARSLPQPSRLASHASLVALDLKPSVASLSRQISGPSRNRERVRIKPQQA